MGKTILIIEDETDLAEVTGIGLKSYGFDVLSAESAEKALDLLKSRVPDLILLDLLLPGMQGEELCLQLKSDKKLKKVPVIIFTASVSHIPDLVKEIGAEDYIIKPFEISDLLDKIKKLTGSK